MFYDREREVMYDRYITDYDSYLDDQYQKQIDEERQQWEEDQEQRDSQPDHLAMINDYEWKDWLGI